jgi:hypothetical protein
VKAASGGLTGEVNSNNHGDTESDSEYRERRADGFAREWTEDETGKE